MPLALFSDPVRDWFTTSFPAPTEPQRQGWPAIAAGDHTLILAPTGSGKTLTAFLWSIDSLLREPTDPDDPHTRVLYISPLRALAVDVERNLRSPLAGARLAAERSGATVVEPTVGLRSGDTPVDERRRMARRPPDILITTPESLFLLLTSQARETLDRVETVIIDEIHALAPTKRGAHLALSLERLEARCARPPQRIGLSATQRPLDEVARYLGGHDGRRWRPVTIVDAGSRKELDVEVVVPIEDMGRLGEVADDATSGPAAGGPVRRSIWPAMHPRLLELIEGHHSTLVFVNARRSAERLATRLNELADEQAAQEREAEAEAGADPQPDRGPQPPRPPRFSGGENFGAPPVGPDAELVMAHHGSLSRERRLLIEDRLKAGQLRGLVCTSSLELGIDMGAVDLVVQVESPRSVAAGLQRIGRAGHQVGEPSRGRIFPKHRADLLEAATVVQRMRAGLIEHTRYPRNPLDVLAQQIVAACALDDWSLTDLAALVRRAANFTELTDEALHATLDLLAGRYPSEEFAELRPRIVWERAAGTLRGRSGAQRLAVTSGGTIPDRGLFGVFLPDGTRVGELDEEMVYESRPGETFLLGASTWRIEEITHERVVVTPAPGQPGKMPFWSGDGPGRPLELGRAVGELVRTVRSLGDGAVDHLRTHNGLDPLAARNLVQYLDEQAEATGAVPDDRTIVVERFRDEIGDWRVCILTPFGAQVHAPWAMALQHRLADRWGTEVELLWSDDGIVLRLPEAVDEVPVDDLLVEPEAIDDLVIARLPNTAMFASRFRECAARALLLPRRRPDRRTPLWQQRQKAADLLAVAARYPSFPILLEATRECINDVFDVAALRQVLSELRSRAITVVAVDTPKASPFAQGLLFSWIAVYMYEGDAPLAEQRAAALSLDRDLLRDLLGAEELRELLDPDVLADLELELQHLADGRRARDLDEVHDLVRVLGPLSRAELDQRCEAGVDVAEVADTLTRRRRALWVTIGGQQQLAAAEDAGRLRDALGVAIPVGLPAAFTEPVDDPLVGLVGRYARTHGPFTTAEVARRFALAPERVDGALEVLAAEGRVLPGEFRPGGTSREWCDDDVLRQLRRRTLAALRKEVEPVDGAALARFLPAWQGAAGLGARPTRRGIDAVADAVATLQGAAVPASILEVDLLAARVADYRPADLDALCTSGEVVWVGAGPLGASDGRLRLLFRDQAGLLVPAPEAPALAPPPTSPPDTAPPDTAAGEGPGAGQAAPDHSTTSPPAAPALSATAGVLLHHLEQRGASFWPELRQAVIAAGEPFDDASVLAALWDLVWAGLVTNDTLAPVRAQATGRRGRAGAAAAARKAGRSQSSLRSRSLGSARRPGGRGALLGPPGGAGRWSLVAPLLDPAPTPTEAAHARALQLLERYGVLTREAALAEGAEGGFAGVYPILKALEERGQVRRGYFVAGLGAAQFALPGAVDRLRAFRDPTPDPTQADPDTSWGPWIGGGDPSPGPARDRDDALQPTVVVLAATDPAQPYGAAIAWPEPTGSARPSRTVGAHVVLDDGVPVLYVEKGGRSLVTFHPPVPTEGAGADAPSPPDAAAATRAVGSAGPGLGPGTSSAGPTPVWPEALKQLAHTGRYRSLEITKVDGLPVRETPSAEVLRAAGFADGYRGLTYRPGRTDRGPGRSG